jgi:hypothetical protein
MQWREIRGGRPRDRGVYEEGNRIYFKAEWDVESPRLGQVRYAPWFKPILAR